MNAPLRVLTAPNSHWLCSHAALGISPMDHLFNRLDGAYPHKWRSAFSGQQAIENWKESWAEAFDEANLTFADVKQGIKACRTKFDWPPSCTEFIKACKPSVDPLVAYYEAINGMQERERGEIGKWSHPAVYYAAIKIGAYDLKHQSYSSIKPRWEAAYNDELERGEWEPIPKPLVALPAPGKTELSAEAASKMIAQAKKIAEKTPSKSHVPPLHWAKLILEREKRGDKTLPAVSVRFAKEALAAGSH